MAEEMWQYSHELDPEEVRKTGCFTTLPVRINNRDDIANGASLKVLKDWAVHTETKDLNMTRVSFSPVGNFCSLVYPETLPERLESISYLTDLFFLIDDATEEMANDKAAQEEWVDFSGAMTASLDEAPKRDHDLEFMKKKKLAAAVMLEFTRIDPALGLELVKSCKAGWTPLAAGVEWADIEEYLGFRRASAGLDIFWGKTVFGLGWKLTDAEEKLIRPLVWAAERAAILNNDYWSWNIEYAAANQEIEQLTNAVAVLMKKEGLSAQEGKDKIKDLIVGYEAEYLRLKAIFYKENPSARFHLRKRVEIAGSVAAGVSFWSANSPRYHMPEQLAEAKATGVADSIKKMQLEEAAASSPAPSTSPSTDGRSLDNALSDESEISNQSSQNDETEKIAAVKSDAGSDQSQFDTPKLSHEALNGPIDYINSMPSKGVRSSLIDAMNEWFQVPTSKLKIVKDVVAKLHNSSLVLDDIQDNSPMRRGKTSAHLIFGNAQSINSANYLYVSVVKAVHDTGNPALMSVILEELDDLHVGQSWDLYWKYNLRWPTENEYFSMIDLKTGGLFRMLIRMMQVLSPLANKDFGFMKMISMVSRYFQVRDDYLNLCSREYGTQKGWCEDLDEGKFSYPIIHCLHANPSYRDRIIGLFRQRIASPDSPLPIISKVQIIEFLQEAGTLDACWKLLVSLEDEIEAEIIKVESAVGEQNPMMHLMLKLLSVKEQKPDYSPIVVTKI